MRWFRLREFDILRIEIAMLPIVTNSETRFWRIFRSLLVPIAVVAFLISLIAGVAAIFGESAVYYDSRPVTGISGLLLSFCYWPFQTVVFSLLAALILYLDRRFKRWRQR